MTTSKLPSFISDNQSDCLRVKFTTLWISLFFVAISNASINLSTPITFASGISRAIEIAIQPDPVPRSITFKSFC